MRIEPSSSTLLAVTQRDALLESGTKGDFHGTGGVIVGCVCSDDGWHVDFFIFLGTWTAMSSSIVSLQEDKRDASGNRNQESSPAVLHEMGHDLRASRGWACTAESHFSSSSSASRTSRLEYAEALAATPTRAQREETFMMDGEVP